MCRLFIKETQWCYPKGKLRAVNLASDNGDTVYAYDHSSQKASVA